MNRASDSRWATIDIGLNYGIVNRRFYFSKKKNVRRAFCRSIHLLAQRDRTALSSPAPRLAYGGMLIGK